LEEKRSLVASKQSRRYQNGVLILHDGIFTFADTAVVTAVVIAGTGPTTVRPTFPEIFGNSSSKPLYITLGDVAKTSLRDTCRQPHLHASRFQNGGNCPLGWGVGRKSDV